MFALLISTLLESIALQATCHIGRRIFVHVTSICNTAVFEKSIRRKDISAGAKDTKDKSKSNDEDADDASKPINVSSKSLSLIRAAFILLRIVVLGLTVFLSFL